MDVLDRRTCADDDIAPLTARAVFEERFTALSRANGQLVADAARQLGTRALTVECGDEVWSMLVEGQDLHIRPGSARGALVVRFTPDELSSWAQHQRSLNSFLLTGTDWYRGGDERDISLWDSLLLTLLYGWPTVGEVDFVDRHGAPLDLDRCFTPDDDPDEVAHFLREAGFLHLRGWVDPGAMAEISADMDRERPGYVEGDGRSWWAEVEGGDRVCVRMQEWAERSPATAAMLRSDRWEQLRDTLAAGERFEPAPVGGRRIEALVKPLRVVSGPSDLTFHRDCYLGRHAYDCAGVTVGVSVTASSEANGQLRVIPGSHRVAMPVHIAMHEPFLPVRALTTEVGDLTVHLSCTLHEATPPVVSERRVLYTGFGLEARPSRAGAAAHLSELREQVTDILRDRG
jgi:hypothetical protein